MTTMTRMRTAQTAARLDPRTDADLLARFLQHHDQAAFTALVQRHGPLVNGVCRRALGASADADDAFQATFLVLVKRAAAVPWRANLGPWLYGVAHRVSAKARFRRDRRFALEKQVDAMPEPATTPAEPDDLNRLFDEELAKLPEEMRRAVVLCELQGLSRREAAKQLRVSEGTLSSRLGRARKKLAAAMAERGVTLAIPAGVGVSVVLASATARAACDPAGAVPAGVSFLVQEALKAMTISKLKLGAVLAAVAVGCSWAALADDKPVTPPAAVKADPPKAHEPEEPAKKRKMELSVSLRTAREPVATVNGQDIKREEFGEHLIRKYGAKEIELFVNKKVIEDAAAKANVSVTDAEIDAAFDADVKGLTATRDEFVKVVLPKYVKTEGEWRDDVIRPRLLIQKMLGEQVTVTDDDLKKLFERKYGERRGVRMILWDKSQKKETLENELSRLRNPQMFFYAARHQSNPALASGGGKIQPMGRTSADGGDQAILDVVFGLKQDEVSGLIDTKQGWVAVMLDEIHPPRTDKKFDDEKAALRVEAMKEKVEAATPKLFAKLKDEAKPVFHLKPEPKANAVPLPLKK
jgi:RNA polymerase sigma factor (sigma-70 family)